MKIPKIIKEPYGDGGLKGKSQLAKVDDGQGGKVGERTLQKVDGEAKPTLQKIDVETKKPLELVVRDESSARVDKAMAAGGVEGNKEELQAAMNEYGVGLTAENFALAGEHARALPEWARGNSELIAILVARRLPTAAFGSVLGFLEGGLRYNKLFARLEKGLLEGLRQNWSGGQMADALLKMIEAGGKGGLESARKMSALVEGLASELGLQELSSILAGPVNENQIFFRWPLFWHGQELPDTLEGEAFVPNKKDAEQGFGLRLLVTPPTLGQIEVKLNSLGNKLWVALGAEEGTVPLLKAIFDDVREAILNLGDYEAVQLSVKGRGPSKNFFVAEPKLVKAPSPAVSVDFKV